MINKYSMFDHINNELGSNHNHSFMNSIYEKTKRKLELEFMQDPSKYKALSDNRDAYIKELKRQFIENLKNPTMVKEENKEVVSEVEDAMSNEIEQNIEQNIENPIDPSNELNNNQFPTDDTPVTDAEIASVETEFDEQDPLKYDSQLDINVNPTPLPNTKNAS